MSFGTDLLGQTERTHVRTQPYSLILGLLLTIESAEKIPLEVRVDTGLLF